MSYLPSTSLCKSRSLLTIAPIDHNRRSINHTLVNLLALVPFPPVKAAALVLVVTHVLVVVVVVVVVVVGIIAVVVVHQAAVAVALGQQVFTFLWLTPF